jgi:hypothetical protein
MVGRRYHCPPPAKQGLYDSASLPTGGVFTTARPRPTRASVIRHPCLQSAFFLPCASLPPDVCHLRLYRPRPHKGARDRRAFVTTRSGTNTMARRRQDTEDEITEADDTDDAATLGNAPTRGPGQATPPSVPADLRTVIAMPTTFGPKLFEITVLLAVSTACKVKDTGDLCSFVTGFLRSSGPPTCGL